MYTWPGQPMGTSRPHAAVKAKLVHLPWAEGSKAELLIEKDMQTRRAALQMMYQASMCSYHAWELPVRQNARHPEQFETGSTAEACCAQMRMRPYRMRVQRRLMPPRQKQETARPY